jgi:nucleotide-binding universal stress UspA family protein
MNSSFVPGSIVVGIDGSDGAERALVWAAAQARLERRPLVLVHAVDARLNLWIGEPAFDVAGVTRLMQDDGRTLLEAARASVAGDDLVVHTLQRTADPRQVLLDLSAEASTIVLGSRGRGPLRSLLLGSVGVAVIQHARCPVVVVRPAYETDGVVGAGDVVVGLTSARPASIAVETAFRQASLRSLPLTVVHGFWDPLLGFAGAPVETKERAEQAQEAEQVVETLAPLREKFPDVAVSYRLAQGLPDDCLVAASHGSAMVVVGTLHPGTAAGLLMGNVARSVTEHAHCPVLVVPEAEIAP